MKSTLLMLMVGAMLAIFTTKTQAQVDDYGVDHKWSDLYAAKNRSAMEYINIAKRVNWIPRKDGKFEGSYELFEKVFIEIAQKEGLMKQLKIDGEYYCGKDHELLFYKYNKYYNTISRDEWDNNCDILNNLMRLDKKE